jgi:hypothetical protein
MNIETKLAALQYALMNAKIELFFAVRFSEARRATCAFSALTLFDLKLQREIIKRRHHGAVTAVAYAAKALAILRA